MQEGLRKLSISNSPTSITAEIIKSTEQISLLKKELGEAEIIISIVKIIAETSLLVSFDGDGEVFGLWAKLLMQNYWWIRLEEMSYVFVRGASGTYGKIYGKINYSILCEWLNNYNVERTHIFRRIESEKRNSFKLIELAPELIELWKEGSRRAIAKDIEFKEETRKVVSANEWNTLEGYLKLLPTCCKEMTDEELQKLFEGMKKTTRFDGTPITPEAIQIIENEIKSRK